MDEAFDAHYNLGVEQARLVPDGEPTLELVRTLELLERYLPPPPADILDVGGGAGVYASLLARRGYRVHLLDVLDPPRRASGSISSSAARGAIHGRSH